MSKTGVRIWCYFYSYSILCSPHFELLLFVRSRHLRLMAYTVRPYATSRRQHLLHNCSTHAWSGFIKADEKAKLQSVLNKAVRYRFLTNYKPVEYLFQSPDTTLFSVILRRPGHVLHPLLPPLNTTGYHLRKRNHGLKLSPV